MLTDAQQEHLAQAVRPMQIIVGALAAGVLSFLVIVLIISRGAQADPFLTYIALGFAVLAFAGWVVVPQLVTSQARRSLAKGDTASFAAHAALPAELREVGQLAAAFQTRLIVANALVEGAAFFSLVAYMLEGQRLCLGVAIVFVLLIISQIPTRNRLQEWVSRELETIELKRR